MVRRTDKSKAAGVSASSFLDLQAELAQQQTALSMKKKAGESTALVGGVQRPGKKVSKWKQSNPGLQKRIERDFVAEAVERRTVEDGQRQLTRKSELYELLKHGDSSQLTDAQRGELLFHYDEKYEGSSDDEGESNDYASGSRSAGNMVVYQDEFGREHRVPRSEVPGHLVHKIQRNYNPDVIYAPQGFWPVHYQDQETIDQINRTLEESAQSPEQHFDANGEIRTRGAGFYALGKGEERIRNRAALDEERAETIKKRADLGAVDVRPGEVEGMRAEEDNAPGKSRAQEKRKRELEERRKQLDAKRRKKTGVEPDTPQVSPPPPFPPSKTDDGPLAQDPFAVLEARAKPDKDKAAKEHPPNAADAFLAQLESEVLNGRAR